MDRLQNMGMPLDRRQCVTLERVNDHAQQFSIANARRLIYERNYAVDSKSLVPTLVSSDFLLVVKD
jgi:hypothetical protein